MSVSSSNPSLSSNDPSLSDDDVSIPKPEEYKFDVKLEIMVKEGSGTLNVVAIFRELVRRMKEVAEGKPLVVLTAADHLIFDNKDLSSEEFKKEFKLEEIEGRVPKVLLGFKLRTTIPLSEIKKCLMPNFLIPNGLFLREHTGGFQNGLKYYTYGFLKDEHPDHPDIAQLEEQFSRLLASAWKRLDKDEKIKWKKQLPQAFPGHGGTNSIKFPVIFTKDRVTAEVADKLRVVTYALMVTTPTQYGQLLRTLLNTSVLEKKITNLIPYALSRENPAGYYNVIVNQERFMEVHRNIPVSNVPILATSQVGIKGKTLSQVLCDHKDVLRVAYDPKNCKYHVSTKANHYRDVHQWIAKELQDHKFSFSPNVRQLKYGAKSTFSSLFTEAMSVTSEPYDASTIKTTRSMPWKQRPPLDISYVPDVEAFPVLSKPTNRPTPVTPSTASVTYDDETIQSAISAAFKKLEDQHREELEILKKDMQSKITVVENQMKELGKQVALQTYQALVTEESPLVTKSDHALLQHEMNVISTQLSTLIQMFQSGAPSVATTTSSRSPSFASSPPRTTKRSKPNTTPVKLFHDEDMLTQDNSVSSATSDPQEGMEGCEE